MDTQDGLQIYRKLNDEAFILTDYLDDLIKLNKIWLYVPTSKNYTKIDSKWILKDDFCKIFDYLIYKQPDFIEKNFTPELNCHLLLYPNESKIEFFLWHWRCAVYMSAHIIDNFGDIKLV
jgi:hypothetical protein